MKAIMGASKNYFPSRNFGFLSETRKMRKKPARFAGASARRAGVARGYVEDFLRNLTKSQPKSQNCSRKVVFRGALIILAAGVLFFAASCSMRVERNPDILADTFVSDPTTLNPILAPDYNAYTVYKYIYESLLDRDNESLELVPKLAKHYEISTDHLSYTFWLRDGVKWQDGEPLTIDDVLYTFEKIRDPKVDAAGIRNYFSDVERIEKIGTDAVRIIFSRPYFKALEVIGSIMILPKHVFDNGTDFNTHVAGRKPIGSGPYRFLEWNTGRNVKIARSDDYWGKRPEIAGIIFSIIPDRTVAFELLKKGAVDYMSVNAIQWLKQTQDKRFVEQFDKFSYYLPNSSFIAWNERTPFFKDRRVRVAMTMLINRKEILDKILFGQGEIISSDFYKFGPYYDKSIEPYPYDPVAAQKLLDEAGWIDHDGDGIRDRDGVPFKFSLLSAAGGKFSKSLGLFLKEDFSKSGIILETKQFEWATTLNLLSKREFDAVAMGMAHPLTQDPFPLWHSSQAEQGSNLTGFADARADIIMEKARVEFDAKRRGELFRELQKILHDEEPCTFLFTNPTLEVVSKRFENVKTYRGGLDASEWKVAPWPVMYEW